MKDAIDLLCICLLSLTLYFCGQETASIYLLVGYQAWKVIQ